MNDDLQAFASEAAAALDADQDQAIARGIAATLVQYGLDLRAGGMPDRLVAALVIQAGQALWSGCGCEGE